MEVKDGTGTGVSLRGFLLGAAPGVSQQSPEQGRALRERLKAVLRQAAEERVGRTEEGGAPAEVRTPDPTKR